MRINEGGAGVAGGATPTVRLTGKVIDPAVVFTTTRPLKPAPERPAGLTVVVTMPVPTMDATSQFCPVVVEVDTLLIATGEPLKVMATFCDTLFDPNGTLKFSGFGLAIRPEISPQTAGDTVSRQATKKVASVRIGSVIMAQIP